MISKHTIDSVYEAARVEEVIGDFVSLKKSGSNYKGLSPFSDERTPSFMVSPVKQIWKDFSSGKGGNIVSFLMEHEHFTFPEAIKYLAKKYQIEVEETEATPEQKQAADERESLYILNNFAKEYFVRQLHLTEAGKAIAKTYFQERGFSEETIKTFELGYSPDQWDAFTSEAIKKGYQLDFLEKTGLTIVKEEKKFDRFKGRVMFPILSMSGRVLGFGGRILSNTKKAAKYLNSPESIVYNKSKILYGMYHAKQSIAKEDECYLVEGYTDVIQMHQSGVQNVVASSGTALTSDQIRLVKRLTNNLTLLFDGDAAGLRAALRGVDLILEQDMNVKVCTFPEGEDPDSYAKAHTETHIRQFLKDNAQDFIAFKAELMAAEAKDNPVQKAELVRDVVQSIAKIPDPIKQELYLKDCAVRMEVSEEVLFSTLAQLQKKEAREEKRKNKPQPFEVSKPDVVIEKINEKEILERKLLEILVLYGSQVEVFEDLVLKEDENGELKLEPEEVEMPVHQKIFLDLQEDEIEFTTPVFHEVYTFLIQKLQNTTEEVDLGQLVQTVEPEKSEILTSILMDEERNQLHDWKRKEIYVKEKQTSVVRYTQDTILNLRRILITEKIRDLITTVPEDMKQKMSPDIKEEIMDYNTLNRLVYTKLNRVV